MSRQYKFLTRLFVGFQFVLIVCCSLDKKNDVIKNVVVVAHRGDWRNAPENSIASIQNCINMGVDMVEFDITMTKDSVLVLMHDKTLERSTTGIGKVNAWTYDSLSSLYLKDHLGRITDQRIPTFKQAMITSKGKIQVFVDKGYEYLPWAYRLLRETGTVDQAHFLGFVSGDKFSQDYPVLSSKVNFIPLVLPTDTVPTFLESFKIINSPYFLFSFSKDIDKYFSHVSKVREKSYAMVTTQVDYFCGGHTDSVSMIDPSNGWGWLIDKGFNAICTDNPGELLDYLKKQKLHD